MNLFSRLDALLDGAAQFQGCRLHRRRFEAERLLRRMEAIFACTRRTAVRLIAAERSVKYELVRLRQRLSPDRVLLERLEEEYARSKVVRCSVLESLHELREGLEHARVLRDAQERLRDLHQEVTWHRWWRQFWRAYHRLCDLADAGMDRRSDIAF
jgi:hypothetical protein